MASRRFEVKLALALVVATAIAAAAQDPRQVRPTAPTQAAPRSDTDARRLGRPYPAPIPALPPREAPGVYVSVVSPRDAGKRQRQNGSAPSAMGGRLQLDATGR